MKVSAAHYSLYSVMLGSDLHIATGKRPLGRPFRCAHRPQLAGC